ncbi:MAG: RNA-splicing ligase RtcB [Candidatus Latescibacteria bacterium 4484_7]|nr:MAG: RNA-splicing ligase RtcB [Candidatus Latescibacteria bacterium 4484_7]
MAQVKLRKIHDYLWEIPREGKMKVAARVYADSDSIRFLQAEGASKQWDALMQLKNVSTLPGIERFALAMADIHPGYGFPIGGVAAFDIDSGVVSMAGVGFDINCGVRAMAVELEREDVEKRKEELAEALFGRIPAGLGSTGKLKLSINEMDEVLVKGARFALERGYGSAGDLEFIEEGGVVEGADPGNVSFHAKERQLKQVGTLGSGNHYLEVQYVEKIYDDHSAEAFGLHEGQIVVSIHTGSRALGHQIGTDYLKVLKKATGRYGIDIPELELVAAPIGSPEGKQYISAVKAGINCAFANRQVIGALTRGVFVEQFGLAEEAVKTIYEVGHNNLKFERHRIDGTEKMLLVHRKGATRAFGKGRPEVPKAYRDVGQPVLVGGTMGTYSYILVGTEKGMEETFGSSVHGAGRLKSRKRALKDYRGESIVRELEREGIIVKVHSRRGAAEEAPGAYKNVERVVDIMVSAGVSKKVVRLKPMICIKG